MNALHGILAAYRETENEAKKQSGKYYALAAMRFEEGRPELAALNYRRALRMETFAAEMHAAEVLLRTSYEP